MKTIGDVFTGDVMYHKNCLLNYVTQFQRNAEDLMTNDFENIDRTSQKELLKNFLDNLEITKKGYVLSEVRDALNNQLDDNRLPFTNRSLKNLLIDQFGEKICFTYPKGRKKSQRFFSTDISSKDVAETLRTTASTSIIPDDLLQECLDYDFGISGSFNSAEDIDISFERYTQTVHKNGRIFSTSFFPSLKDHYTSKENVMEYSK